MFWKSRNKCVSIKIIGIGGFPSCENLQCGLLVMTCLGSQVVTNVSDELDVSIFRGERCYDQEQHTVA